LTIASPCASFDNQPNSQQANKAGLSFLLIMIRFASTGNGQSRIPPLIRDFSIKNNKDDQFVSFTPKEPKANMYA